jgi:hypothetical protein
MEQTKKIQDTAMYQTKDYDSFKLLNYNRTVDDVRVEGLMESIKKNGFLMPILVSSDMQVADGQHRLEAAKRLNVPVSYIQYNIGEGNLPILISKLNSLSKNWNSTNYYEMWNELGREPYVWMGNIIIEHDITFNELFLFIKGSFARIGHTFKDGTLKLTESQRTRIINQIEKFNKIINFSDVFAGEGFGGVFRSAVAKIVVHPDYDEDRMHRKLKKDAGRLLGCINKIDFIMQLEHVYNHGERSQIDFLKSKSKKSGRAKQKSSNGCLF